MGKKKQSDARHRKRKAALAAGAVAGTVAATAAYRRRQAGQHRNPAHRPHPADDQFATSGAETTQPL